MKATKSKGKDMPECVAPSFPINYILGFCMSHWKYSLRGLLAKFPLSFCCYLLLWYPCFCNFAVDKMSLFFFLALQQEEKTEREESRNEEGFSESCCCTCRGESLALTGQHKPAQLSAPCLIAVNKQSQLWTHKECTA